MKNPLIGIWISDPQTVDIESDIVKIEFKPDGQLIHTIIKDHRNDIILLTYRIEGNMIVTDQPSDPREERTKFQLTADHKLLLTYQDSITSYIKVKS